MNKKIWCKPNIQKLKVSETKTGNGNGAETAQKPHKNTFVS